MSTELEVFDAELVEGDTAPRPAATEQGPRYLVTQHTMLGPGELPPTVEQEPPGWTDADFRISPEDVADLGRPRGAENTGINRKSTLRRFETWCTAQSPPRMALPCTTATYTAYGLHLIRLGRAGKYKPDSVSKYMSRIWNAQPKGRRPDRSHFLDHLRTWRGQWAKAGGEVERAATATIEYTLRIIAKIDESTNIGKRDALLLVLAYSNLHREMELADLLVKHLRVYERSIRVTTAASKTDQAGVGATRPIEDRADLQQVRRARAWLGVLRELGADAPHEPLFPGLASTGRLRQYPPERERGNRMRPGSINERVQILAERAGVPYIDGRKVTSHSFRRGANTDMKAAGVALAERNLAGRWKPGSTTADTIYDSPLGVGSRDPLAKIPLYGGPARAAVAHARSAPSDPSGAATTPPSPIR
ncbi:tyrosine-type recombinase/integrase [Streptomyces sp. NPDC002812]|uniref:tyrosine-type recombinase/integrase n=1 Tax=Streptomyces sp. NPDC002812 TaxID=3154434 RepID=UPI00332D2E39